MGRSVDLHWQATPGGYVGVFCDGVPRDAALEALLRWARARRVRVAGVVIEGVGGSLETARSRGLERLSDALDAPVAVLTDSALVRGAAACQWLGARVDAFARQDCDRALDALDVPAEDRGPLRAALWALKVAHRIAREGHGPGASSSAA